MNEQKVFQVEVQIRFNTLLPIEVPKEYDPSQTFRHTEQCLSNKYGYLVEDPEDITFSVIDGLTEPDPLETRIANLYLHNSFAGKVEMHGGTYILHVYKAYDDPEFSITVPVQEKPHANEEKAISQRLVEGIIRQQFQSAELNKNLFEMLTVGMEKE